MTRARKAWLLFTLVITGFLLPTSCIPCVFACNTVNPMALLFLVTFTVENQSGEPIHVTPIGAFDFSTARATLPITISKNFYLIGLSSREFTIPNGESVAITYDADDINFTELIVRTETGDTFSLTTNPNSNNHLPPLAENFVIGPTSTLEKPTEEMLRAARDGRAFNWRLLLVILIGLINPFLFGRQLRAYRSSR